MKNPVATEDRLAQRESRIQTITPGRARGRLLGGNLTVLSAIVGTPFLPDFAGALLFLEDIDERIYRVDRMLTQLEARRDSRARQRAWSSATAPTANRATGATRR